ncbi:vesicle transport through interaction with t-SNAREs homolog 1B-like [Hydractinia symbiolongicarpus]|uniref:vesicle transport through interaction with t-SNAREs homolog 1B-like n=1 Tax=Hydractinia symbiolongicarpus TaxID=13093 RepID=UPI00254A6925|nr:vesicle transport through interaction with t-SNAREs homolog 1B-like [Hydractinia symbiolongicarpus]
MSSEKYEDYKAEFETYFAELEKLKNKIPKLNGEPRKREVRNAEKLIEEADLQLAQMADEAQLAPGAYRTKLLSDTRGHRYQLDKVKKELDRLKLVSTSNLPFGGRDDLLGPTNINRDRNMQQQNKMLEGLDSLNRGSQSVARSQRIAAETDEIGVQIIGDLDDQRESLLRSKDKVAQTNADLTRSRRILNSMAIRLATNKILLVVIIIVEIAILAAVIYLRFIK